MTTNDYVTLTISGCAFVVSVVSTWMSFKGQSKQMRTTVRDQLSSVVQELISTLSDNSILQSEPVQNRDNLFYSKSSSFSHKLSSLARQASALIEMEPGVAFDVELSAVAQALDTAGDTLQADKYFHDAIAASPTDYYRVINKRMYGNFLFRQSKHQQGRKQFEEALELFDNSSDFNKATNGYTYQFWFSSEVWNIPSPHGQAEECYNNAKGLFESISGAGYRANCLRGLETTRAASPLGAPPAMTPPPAVHSPT